MESREVETQSLAGNGRNWKVGGIVSVVWVQHAKTPHGKVDIMSHASHLLKKRVDGIPSR